LRERWSAPPYRVLSARLMFGKVGEFRKKLTNITFPAFEALGELRPVFLEDRTKRTPAVGQRFQERKSAPIVLLGDANFDPVRRRSVTARMADLAVDLGAKRVSVKERLWRHSAKSIGLTAAKLRPVKSAQIGQANCADLIVIPLPPYPHDNFVVGRRRPIVWRYPQGGALRLWSAGPEHSVIRGAAQQECQPHPAARG
jgi:hypothetical protein